jgi:hypothetical protein
MKHHSVLTVCLLSAGLLCAACTLSTAQSPTPERPGAEERGPQGRGNDREGMVLRGRPLPPAERPTSDGERVRRNREVWKELPEEERQAMRERAQEFHRSVRQEAQTALDESGLKLDEATAREFFQRYMHLRRQLEKQLREELNEKRQVGIREIQAEMRKLFAATPGASRSNSAAESSASDEE